MTKGAGERALEVTRAYGSDPEVRVFYVAGVLQQMITDAIRAAILEEREACANIAEHGRFLHDDSLEARFGIACAGAIRRRPQP